MIREFIIRHIYNAEMDKSHYIKLIDKIEQMIKECCEYLKTHTDMDDNDRISIGEVVIIFSHIFKRIIKSIKGLVCYDG